MLGAAASIFHPRDQSLDNSWGVGMVMRLRRHSGFGWTIGFNWLKADVTYDIAGEPTPAGRLIVRPLLLGVTYTHQHASYALTGSLVAGRSFNGLRDTGAAADALAAAGQPGAIFSVSDCFAYRPSVSIWWELGNRFGLLTSLSYFSARPEIVTRTPSGTFRRPVDVSGPALTVGFGYGIF